MQTTTESHTLNSPPRSVSTTSLFKTGHLAHSFCGGATYLLVKSLVHPLDTIRVRLMAEHMSFVSPISMAKRMMSREGFASFFKGISAAGSGAFAGNFVYFGIYEKLKETFQFKYKYNVSASSFAAAIIAQTGCNIMSLPFDVIRTRMQAPSGNNIYTSLPNAVKKIIQTEGLKGFYPGWKLCFMTDILSTGLAFALYERLKRYLLRRRKNLDEKQVFLDTSLAYFVASTTVSLLNVPLALILTRIQLNSTKGKHLTFLEVGKSVYKHEGLKGFYKGWSARLMIVSSTSILAMACYETLKQRLGILKY